MPYLGRSGISPSRRLLAHVVSFRIAETRHLDSFRIAENNGQLGFLDALLLARLPRMALSLEQHSRFPRRGLGFQSTSVPARHNISPGLLQA